MRKLLLRKRIHFLKVWSKRLVQKSSPKVTSKLTSKIDVQQLRPTVTSSRDIQPWHSKVTSKSGNQKWCIKVMCKSAIQKWYLKVMFKSDIKKLHQKVMCQSDIQNLQLKVTPNVTSKSDLQEWCLKVTWSPKKGAPKKIWFLFQYPHTPKDQCLPYAVIFFLPMILNTDIISKGLILEVANYFQHIDNL